MQYLEASRKQEEVVTIQKELSKRTDVTREQLVGILQKLLELNVKLTESLSQMV